MVMTTYLSEHAKTHVTDKELSELIQDVNKSLGGEYYVVEERSYTYKKWFKIHTVTNYSKYYRYNGLNSCDVQALMGSGSEYKETYSYFLGLYIGLTHTRKKHEY